MKSIYLVLDMQNDLVHPEGASGKGPLGEQVRSRELIARTAAAIAKARSKGIAVAFVRVAFSDDHREARLPGVRRHRQERHSEKGRLGRRGA